MDKLLHLRWISTVKSTAWKDPVHEQNISKTQRNVIFTALVLRNGLGFFIWAANKNLTLCSSRKQILDSKKLCPLLHSTYCLSSFGENLLFVRHENMCMHFKKKGAPQFFPLIHGPQEVCVFVEVCVQRIKWRKQNRWKTSATNGKDRIKVLPNKIQIRLLLWGYETYS